MSLARNELKDGKESKMRRLTRFPGLVELA
jgi:hypothetical protein